MRYPQRIGRLSVPGRKVQLATAAMLLVATTVAACGDSQDDGAKASAPKAPATIPELTKDPLTLSFIWFEWPPAQALEDFANAEYKKERPNVTIKVNTVPNANWHDAMFTQFAARKTDFDIAILDSQHIGEAVTNGNILDLTDFVKKNIDVKAYNPYLLAAYGQFPQAETGKRDENASLYGLPLLGDTWTMIYRKDLIGDKPPQTWDEMISAAEKCQADNPGVSGLAFHQANGSDAAAVTYNTVNGVYGGNLWDAKDAQDRGRPQRRGGPGGDGRPGQQDEAADRQGLRQLVHRRGERGGRPGQGMHRVQLDRRERRPARPEAVDARHHRGSRFSTSWVLPPCRARRRTWCLSAAWGCTCRPTPPRRTRRRP